MRRAPSGVPAMRIVADTNTVLSGLLWQGPPRRLLDLARGRALTLCTSFTLVAELAEVSGALWALRRYVQTQAVLSSPNVRRVVLRL